MGRWNRPLRGPICLVLKVKRSPTADDATTGPLDREGLEHTSEEVLIQNESLFVEVKEMDINHKRDCKDSAWALPKKDKKKRKGKSSCVLTEDERPAIKRCACGL